MIFAGLKTCACSVPVTIMTALDENVLQSSNGGFPIHSPSHFHWQRSTNPLKLINNCILMRAIVDDESLHVEKLMIAIGYEYIENTVRTV